MDKIYVIISGAYSDWRIEGYETDREKAEMICYHHNQLPDHKRDWLYDNWYVKTVDKVEHETGNHNLYWNYDITIYKRETGYEFEDYEEDNYVQCDNKAYMPEIIESRHSYRIKWSNTRFLNYENAKKIAMDMLMQDLAARLLEGKE